MMLPPLLEHGLQAMLPTRWLSALMHRFAAIQQPWIKQATIDFVRRTYAIDMSEAQEEDPQAYASFNDFFTRSLKPGSRPLAEPPALLSPVDGTISQWGRIHGDTVFQAKGRSFSAGALLGDNAAAQAYQDGEFATIYLAPYNYHRIHMPMAARLVSGRYIPGRLFSVQPSTVQAIDGLFARNERLALHFESASGPFAMVLVGALFVGSIETVIEGKISPPHWRAPRDYDYRNQNVQLDRGEELGRFNMGSTVILLQPPGMARWREDVGPGDAVRMGQSLGQLVTTAI